MRILYLTDTYAPDVTGIAVVTGLAVVALQARGHVVGVVAPRSAGSDVGAEPGAVEGSGTEVLATVPSIALPLHPMRWAAPAFFAVSRAAARFQPDLIHCTTALVLGRLGQMIAKRLDVPVVTSYQPEVRGGRRPVRWLEPAVRAYLARFYRRADLTLIPSRAAMIRLRMLGIHRTVFWEVGLDPDSDETDWTGTFAGERAVDPHLPAGLLAEGTRWAGDPLCWESKFDRLERIYANVLRARGRDLAFPADHSQSERAGHPPPPGRVLPIIVPPG